MVGLGQLHYFFFFLFEHDNFVIVVYEMKFNLILSCKNKKNNCFGKKKFRYRLVNFDIQKI